MKRAAIIVASFLISLNAVLAQEQKGSWTGWIPVTTVTYSTYRRDRGHVSFDYRYRISTPCSGNDCSFDMQLRNKSDARQSVNYILYIEKDDGHIKQASREYTNIDPGEVQALSVSEQGTRINDMKITVD